MAVQNYFTNRTTMGPPALPTNAIAAITGVKKAFMQNTVNPAAADSSGSTYLLFQDVPFNAKFADLGIETDNLGAGAVIQIGLADPATASLVGAANSLSGNLSAAAATTKLSPLDGLAALTHQQTQQCLYEIAGDTFVRGTPVRDRYDVIITLSTAGGSAGAVTGRGTILPAG